MGSVWMNAEGSVSMRRCEFLLIDAPGAVSLHCLEVEIRLPKSSVRSSVVIAEPASSVAKGEVTSEGLHKTRIIQEGKGGGGERGTRDERRRRERSKK